MAPELAMQVVASGRDGPVLDPMCGSGTVLRAAVLSARPACGFDVDPLAVLMARVWTTAIDSEMIEPSARRIIRKASLLRVPLGSLPWQDSDPETRDFVRYWFSEPQRLKLRKLALALKEECGPMGDVLKLALSKTIVTKDRGASLARDVSHSRPHRVLNENSYDVDAGFLRASHLLSRSLTENDRLHSAEVNLGDARRLQAIPDGTVATVVTSPPYLNAIDYLRGHRLSLVWLGWNMQALRKIRSESVGAERALTDKEATDRINEILGMVDEVKQLPSRLDGIFRRFAYDVMQLMMEVARVLRPSGEAVFVVGNSTVRGVYLNNAELVKIAAQQAGMQVVDMLERSLPPNNRYLPPPRADDKHPLSRRMRSETIITAIKE
jgi:DNA modification methylase